MKKPSGKTRKPGEKRSVSTRRPKAVSSNAEPEKVNIGPLDPPPPDSFQHLPYKVTTRMNGMAHQERVRRARIEELKSLLGSVHLEIDISNSRRRP